MLRVLTEADFAAASTLLAEGFPQSSPRFWAEALQAFQRHAANAETGFPPGWILFEKGQAAGIALTPASLRWDAQGKQRTLVNVSSWYVRPESRWRAAPMFRSVLADPKPIYIDVTPTEEVGKLLKLSGFEPISRGTVFGLLHGHAMRPSSAFKVRRLGKGDPLPIGSPPARQIESHRELGCVPLLVEHPAGETLLIYRPQRLRGFRVARLLFVGSHATLHRCMGALARHLLPLGFSFVSWDRRETTPKSLFNVVRSGGVWYARGDDFADQTDFIGTELSMLEL